MNLPKSDFFWVRVAGLPGSTVLELRARDLDRHLIQLDDIEHKRRKIAGELADQLHAWIGSAPLLERRQLLALRRDVHNLHSTAKHSRAEIWPKVLERCPEARELAMLEDEATSLSTEIELLYVQERRRAIDALLRSASDPSFQRGLTLASPDLQRRLQRVGGLLSAEDLSALKPRKRKKVLFSLLRYVSRAATKLSPYSTFTKVALGRLIQNPETRLPDWVGKEWRERSCLRIRRYLTEQLAEAWRRWPENTSHLPVAANLSVERVDAHFRYLRPPAWRLTSDGSALEPRPLLLARASANPIFQELMQILGNETRTHAAIIAELISALDLSPQDAATVLDKALELGLVVARYPWPDHSPRIDAELLREISQESRQDATTSLSRLVQTQQDFAHAESPDRHLARIFDHLEETWRALSKSTSLENIQMWRPNPIEVYEDVLVEPADESPGIEWSAETASRILQDLDPWAEIVFALDHRFDFLHTLSAAARRLWPSRRKIGALELFASCQELWSQFLAFRPENRYAAFNPLNAEPIQKLARIRRRIWQRLDRVIREAEDGQLRRADVAEITADLPESYRCPVGPCALLQAADDRGRLWVLNHLFEGTGRYGSRFVHLLPKETRERYLANAIERSVGGETEDSVALLDLAWSHGDHLAAHPRMTRKILVTPGENPASFGREAIETAPWEAVAPNDLVVLLPDADDALPLLFHRSHRLVPVHLGGAASVFLPTWLRYLATWGPDSTMNLSPPANWRRLSDEVEVLDRLTLGSVVIRRKRWRVTASSLRQILSPGFAGYRALHRWLASQHIPSTLFLIERVAPGHYKPQFLDLAAPLFVELLQAVLAEEEIILEEALPTPDLYRPTEGPPRAQEFLLDALPVRGLS